MSQIRLIAMDMDGTLLDDHQQIPKENELALKAAVAKGVDIAICSGRLGGDVFCYTDRYDLPTCHVLSLNGGCGFLLPHQEPYAAHMLRPETLQAVLEVLEEQGVTYACFQPNRVIVMNEHPSVNPISWGTYLGLPGAPEKAEGAQALQRYQAEGVCKVVYIDPEQPSRLAHIREQLDQVAGLSVTSSWSDNLELMPQGIDKGYALRELTEKLGYSADEVMAIGDYDNDLSMIEYAGVGVAMQNGSERVKNAANYLTTDNLHAGVAAAIRKFLGV